MIEESAVPSLTIWIHCQDVSSERLTLCRGQSDQRQSSSRFTQGLQGLAGGFSSGVTGLYRSPMEGYSTGRKGGLAMGLGRGLLGVVGLPLSGALDLVSSVSAGVAATAGVSHTPQLRRPGLTIGKA